MVDISRLRREYMSTPLRSRDMRTNPFEQLAAWLKDAHDIELPEPNAMVLATASREGIPSSRTVLLRSLDDGMLTFFTNYGSRKAAELNENPVASCTLLWLPLIRQVTIDGAVKKLSREATEAYWLTRPRGSQLAAWASQQGQQLPSRELLEERYRRAEQRFDGHQVPCPEHWGGYALMPTRFEFWQGREHRLHDRINYRLDGATWVIERLAP